MKAESADAEGQKSSSRSCDEDRKMKGQEKI